jgi:hypothetical protein
MKGVAVLPTISVNGQGSWGMQEAWGRGFNQGMTAYRTAAVYAGVGKESFRILIPLCGKWHEGCSSTPYHISELSG